MSSYFGDFDEDATVLIPFNTFDSNDPSASVTITNLVDADLKVHKDGNATPIVTDGATIAIDFASITGNHLATIDTSVDAAYATGSDYDVRMEGTTIDGATVNAWLGSFSIENRFMRGTDSAVLASTVGTPSDFGSGTSTIAANLEDMADNGTAAYDRGTDSLQAIRDRGDAAWTTGAGGSNPFVLQNTTITGLASQTTFNLTAGSADDGAYEKMLAVVEDSATATQKAIGVIATYTGSTKTIVLREDPGIFTMANGDTIDVVVVSPDILDILADVGNISAVGAAIHVTAIASPGGFVLTAGSEVNTEDATVALDGTKHELSDAAGTLDGLYKFDIGGDAAPVSVTFTGNFNSNNDTFDIFGNTGTDGTPVWVQIGSIVGSNSSANTVHTLTMFNNMIVTDVAGEVQVRVQATGLTSSSFDVDQVFVSKADTSRSVGYANGRIFINTNASNTNTESFVDGVADNPVSTIAAAKTLSTNVGLGDFHTINGSSITLAETSDNESYFGDNYSLALGGQSCADIHVEGALVSGTGTAATGEMHFEGSSFLTTASVQSGHFDFTRFAGTVTFSLAGDYQLHNCYSGVAGAAGPTFAFAAAAITAEWRNWSGSINLTGLTSDDTVTIGGRLGTVDLGSPGSAAVVEIRGTYKEITNAGSASVNTDGAIKGVDVVGIKTTIGTAGAGLTDITINAASVDLILDEVNTGAAHNVVNSLGRQVRETRQTNVYADNRIWIDTINGASGTTDYENGTLDNPVDNIADANTLAASLGISRFMILNGSSITFAATQTSQNFLGDNWTLALGGQSIVGTKITGATVTGIASGTGTLQIFEGCRLGATSHIKDTHLLGCSLSGTQTLVEAGDIFFDQCYSAIAGMGTVSFDFGAALNSSNLNVRHHSGGWTIANMGAGTGTYQASFEGHGQIIWAASCSATSNASIRGAWKITDNASGAVTEIHDDTTTDVDAVKTQTDKLVFTVANQLDVNIQSVNDVPVTGTGASGDEWGP